MKNNLIFLFIVLLTVCVYGQQEAQYTQYMYNTASINPAYAGTSGNFSITGLHRSQWVGLDGAPTTQTINLSSPIMGQLAGGLSIVNDKIGPSTETYLDVDFSYAIKLNETAKFSFGLKAGLNILDVDFNKLEGGDDQDFLFEENIDNRVMPNVGVGAYLYGDNFYLGLSAPKLLETDHYDEQSSNGTSFLATEKIHAYLIGGYVWDLNYNFKFKPAFLLKGVEGSPLQVDVSANFLYQEKFVLGTAYRWDSAMSAMAGFQLSNQIFVGYAYDFDTTEIRKYNSGSHELVLRFEFKKRSKIDLSPRFF